MDSLFFLIGLMFWVAIGVGIVTIAKRLFPGPPSQGSTAAFSSPSGDAEDRPAH